jgi:hypothetical protein
MFGLRVLPFVNLLALGVMRRRFRRRQFGPDQVFVDLGQQHPVKGNLNTRARRNLNWHYF